ncbi:hypothetical protein [Frankia sp. Cj3]|uniref:hypothetical protein n=1 Tax=Frankia sp. Cj3 TaxID=2880976 RepID=UPI001EF72282|nr:hypothetical protein [Frankia sp. Cj3]
MSAAACSDDDAPDAPVIPLGERTKHVGPLDVTKWGDGDEVCVWDGYGWLTGVITLEEGPDGHVPMETLQPGGGRRTYLPVLFDLKMVDVTRLRRH